MLNEFKNWLLNRNYKTSTALDYQGRIERLCRKEAITLEFLAKNIVTINKINFFIGFIFIHFITNILFIL